MEEFEFIEKQYKYAIDARDKLNDNYYKWMSYYYLANAGIIVAITTLFKGENPNGIIILFLSGIGVFISSLWHLSCKGYYYWSKSWINIIIRLEKMMTSNDETFGVYSVFSQEVKNESNFWKPHKPANISTPKLTLLFSFFSILCWGAVSIHQFFLLDLGIGICCKTLISLACVLLIIIIYIVIIPKIKSKNENSHVLV